MSAPEQRASRRRELRVLARYTGAGLVAAVIGYIASRSTHTVTPPWLVVAACVIVGLLVGVAAIVWSTYTPPPGSLPTLSRRRRTDRESGGLHRVERTIERSLREVEPFNARVRPWLIRLAEQRLRHHLTVDRYSTLEANPESARELLGGSLWQLMQQPLTTVPTQQQLAEWVARIETL
jgi:F0F1-type ATP synthase assembly protein I